MGLFLSTFITFFGISLIVYAVITDSNGNSKNKNYVRLAAYIAGFIITITPKVIHLIGGR